jgi:hypothetical protein
VTHRRTILAIALVAGWLGCSSNGKPCGCTSDEVCLSNGACFPACGADGATCPAGLTCVQEEPYCATPPCDASAAVLACIATSGAGRTY